jgi:hypothetical protein
LYLWRKWIIKINKKYNDTNIICSIAIVIKTDIIDFDEYFYNYELKFIWTKPITTLTVNNSDFFYKKIENNITKDNLIEILLENVIDLNIIIF